MEIFLQERHLAPRTMGLACPGGPGGLPAPAEHLWDGRIYPAVSCRRKVAQLFSKLVRCVLLACAPKTAPAA